MTLLCGSRTEIKALVPDYFMSHHIDDEAEDKATRQNEAAATAAKYDYEHWSKTGELRLLKQCQQQTT